MGHLANLMHILTTSAPYSQKLRHPILKNFGTLFSRISTVTRAEN
jgi:hypothetical protein